MAGLRVDSLRLKCRQRATRVLLDRDDTVTVIGPIAMSIPLVIDCINGGHFRSSSISHNLKDALHSR